MSAEDKALEAELDEAFDELSLINCTDLDVSLKIIMLSDEKTAQSIRGDINHLMLKYIATDPSLKDKLKKSDHLQYDTTYLRESYYKARNLKIAYYERKLQNYIYKAFENPSTCEEFVDKYKSKRDTRPFDVKFCDDESDIGIKIIFRLKIPDFEPDTEILCRDIRSPVKGELPGSIIGFLLEFNSDYSDQYGITQPYRHIIKAYYPPDPTLIKSIVEYHNNFSTGGFTVEASLKAIQMRLDDMGC